MKIAETAFKQVTAEWIEETYLRDIKEATSTGPELPWNSVKSEILCPLGEEHLKEGLYPPTGWRRAGKQLNNLEKLSGGSKKNAGEAQSSGSKGGMANKEGPAFLGSSEIFGRRSQLPRLTRAADSDYCYFDIKGKK